MEVVSKINPCRDLRSSQFMDKNRLSKLKRTLSGPFLGKKIIDLRFQNRIQMNPSASEKPRYPVSLRLIQPLSRWML